MIPVKEVQYYINNSCNLSCNNCCSFNDLNLTGYEKWNDYKDKNIAWSKLILPNRVSILGGEPFINPDLINWVRGVRSAWKHHNNITVATNGTLLNKPKAREVAKEILSLNMQLEISVHYEKDYETIYEIAKSILDEMNIPYKTKIDPCDLTGYDDRVTFFHKTHGHILYTISRKYQFEIRSIKEIKNNIINFYNSDVNTAHDACIFRECHYIIKGDLYKCVLTCSGTELSNQRLISSNQKDLLLSYVPCNPLDDPKKVLNFLNEIKNPIDQCALCPTSITIEKII